MHHGGDKRFTAEDTEDTEETRENLRDLRDLRDLCGKIRIRDLRVPRALYR